MIIIDLAVSWLSALAAYLHVACPLFYFSTTISTPSMLCSQNLLVDHYWNKIVAWFMIPVLWNQFIGLKWRVTLILLIFVAWLLIYEWWNLLPLLISISWCLLVGSENSNSNLPNICYMVTNICLVIPICWYQVKSNYDLIFVTWLPIYVG